MTLWVTRNCALLNMKNLNKKFLYEIQLYKKCSAKGVTKSLALCVRMTRRLLNTSLTNQRSIQMKKKVKYALVAEARHAKYTDSEFDVVYVVECTL